MFHSARLKLTSWYLVIIMAITLVFSLIIYQVTTLELERGLRRFGNRIDIEGLEILLPPRLQREQLDERLIEDLEIAKHLILIRLLTIDGAILIISALAGWFLAGKTLLPIEIALEEQKRFVGDASHELRTPLTALKTSTEVVLRSKKLNLKQARQALESNLEEIEQLDNLSSDLLSLAKLQSSSKTLSFSQIEIKKVVQKVHKQLSPLIKKKKIRLELDANDLTLKADENSLTQMLVILLDNAVKYSKTGGRVWVKVDRYRNQMRIEVKDEGLGISKEDLPHIFDRFYRTDQARSKSQISGFGLGLSLAKRIVKLHGGKIEVSSTVGVGSRFRVII
ncbi:MAG: ATP-binding protein [Patescibacteria group bacterium]